MTGLYFIAGAIITAGAILGYIWWAKSSIQKDVHKLIIDQYNLTAKVAGIQLLQNQHTRRITELENGGETMKKRMSLEEAVLWLKRYQGYAPMDGIGNGKPAWRKHCIDLTDEVVDTILAALPTSVGGTKKD